MSGKHPQSDLDKRIAAAAELRELIPQANGAVKDLRTAIREAREAAASLAGTAVGQALEAALDDRLPALEQAIEASVRRVEASFDAFGVSLLGRETWWHAQAARPEPRQPQADGLLPGGKDPGR